MAAGAVIGALRVVLGADTAALEKGLKDAQGYLKAFATTMAGVAAGISLEKNIERVVKFLVGGVKDAVQAADDLAKAAEKVGIPVEELSRLAYSAKIAEVSLESLTNGLVKFDKNLTDAAAGGANNLAKALKAMGIEIRDGNGEVKAQSQVILEVADKFASYEDGAAKTALALLLFNKRGAEMIPWLNQGAAGISKLMAESDALGNTISGKSAKSADEFNQNLKRLHAMMDGVFRKVAEDLAPALVSLTNSLMDLGKEQTGTERFESISRAVQAVIEDITVAIIKIRGAGREFVALWDVIGGKPFSEITQSWEAFNKAGERTEAEVRAVRGQFALAGQSAIQFAMDYGTAANIIKTKGNAPIVASTDAAKNSFQTLVEQIQKASATHLSEANSVGLGVVAQEKFRVSTELTLAAQKEYGVVTDEVRAKIALLSDQAALAKGGLEGANLVWENTDPMKKYQIELANTIALMQKVKGVTEQDLVRAQDKLAEKYNMSSTQIEGAIGNIAGSFSQLTKTVGKENKALLIASKAFGISQVIIQTHIAAMKSWAEGGIAGPFLAAAAIAAGAASLAAIAAVSFAQGGSFRVPGGMSSNDNHLVPLNLASGERVDITPANQTGGTGNTMQVDMRGGDPYYSRGNVEKLLNAMHTVMADGHQVQLVVLK